MKRVGFLLVLATMSFRPALGQPPPAPAPVEITLRPASEPVPALKYRLVPERHSLVTGNAVVFYHRGIQLLMERRARQAAEEKAEGRPRAASLEQQIAQWVSGPIADIPKDKARDALQPFANALKEAELGAQRASCDWEFDQRTEGIYLLIPEIQEMRSLARLVALRARLATLEGNRDEAMHWIETGLAMARHVSQGPTVIQALVGGAITAIMTHCLEDLIQVPGMPSLYWALADRPQPFIDLRYGLEGERYTLEKEFPELNQLGQRVMSLEEAQHFAADLQRKLFALVSGEPIPGTNTAIPSGLPAAARRLGIAAMAAKIYPEARRALIAQGRPEAEVDAMPIVQVATLYSLQEYRRFRDDTYKWMNVPFWQAYDRIDRSLPRTVEEKLANPLLTMFRTLDPALRSVRLAALRSDRAFDALQGIEAIRLYAGHTGKLPESLESIHDAPVPFDPATGKPFNYKVDGDRATLTAPIPPGGPEHPSFAIRYVLKLAR